MIVLTDNLLYRCSPRPDKPDASITAIAELIGVSRPVIYRMLPELKPDHPAAIGRTATARLALPAPSKEITA
ncbi:hypothetical protein ABT234_12250 [Streptomyces sp. NPDC001586]|uniref:hypothetical protein n=1 Tax=Streptomyces sp. NPDC001586 TaxID=3154387 RepID=UPI00332B5B36